MIKFLISVLVLTIIGAFLGQWLMEDAGYVLIRLGETSVETTLWMAVFLAAVGLGLAILLYKLFTAGLLFPRRFKQALSRRKERRRQKQVISNLLYLVSGNYDKIYDSATGIFSDRDSLELKIINAEALLHSKRYEELIKLCAELREQTAQNKSSKRERHQAHKAANILLARAYLEQAKYSRAMKLLQPYANNSDARSGIAPLLKQAYLMDRRWEPLGELLAKYPDLAKKADLLDFYRKATNLAAVNKHWKSLDKKTKQDPEILACYARAAAKGGNKQEALGLLQAAIKRGAAEPVLEAYTGILADTPLQQLKFLEDQPSAGGNRSEHMLLALAKLSQANKLAAKAGGYYEELIKRYPNTAAANKLEYIRMLRTANNAGDHKKADEVLEQLLKTRTNPATH